VTILSEADNLINGNRQSDYGDPGVNIERIAGMWSAYLGTEVTGEQVCWMMTMVKASRDLVKSKRDNLVDAAGYLGLIERLGEHGNGGKY